MRDFRLRVGAPRDNQRIGARISQAQRMGKERILNDDLRHRICRMRKLQRETNIARRKDERTRGLQSCIYLDAVRRVVCDADPIQFKAFNIGGAADAD